MAARPAVPPEGGYGWIILAAYAANNILIVQMVQNFGLIIKDVFKDLDIRGADAAAIMNTNSAFSLILGLFIGPILRMIGSRNTAIIGVMLGFSGMALTSQASSFIEFLIFYGLIMSAGLGLTYPTYVFAFNSYFRERRSLATGIAMTCTGVSSIFMPQLISLLIREFGSRGTCLLFAGLALQSLVGACLLHPIEWHQRRPESSIEKRDLDPKDEVLSLMLQKNGKEVISTMTEKPSPLDTGEGTSPIHAALRAGDSLVALDGSLQDVTRRPPRGAADRGPLARWLRAVVTFFDLSLLRDLVYVNIMLGLSFAFFAEMNFTIFLPFFFADRGFDTQQIATFLSVMAIADTCLRFLAPFLHRLVGLTSRLMYIGALTALVVCRVGLLFCYSRLDVMIAMAVLGMVRGLRVVYFTLVIPDHVPIERLASAQGLQFVANGIVFFTLGPFIGFLRDYFGTYDVVVVSSSAMSTLTLTMWAIEFVVKAVARRGHKKAVAACLTDHHNGNDLS